jgi:hypothetical protein
MQAGIVKQRRELGGVLEAQRLELEALGPQRRRARPGAYADSSAGRRICSIASARPGAEQRMTTALSHGSSSETS